MRLKPITFLLLMLCFFQAQAQQDNNPDLFFSKYDDGMNWVTLQDHQALSATQFFEKTFSLYGLQHARDMKVVQSKTDKLGWTHYKHHQYFKEVRVEGGTYLLHEKEGKVVKANGVIYPSIDLNTQAGISAEMAIEKAKENHPATNYLWENESAERLLQKTKNNPHATYYPQPELVVVDRTYPRNSGKMALAYKLDLQLQEPIGRYTVYVDAKNGQIIQSYNNLHPTAIDGTAETRYHGTQTISTTQEGGSGGRYMLRDTSRGIVIETIDSWDDYNLVPFYDDDNYWDNVNDRQDEVATDAHYGAQATYDFYKDNFDRHSYDDKGANMTSLVHVGFDWNNASWNGSVMSYGDGDGSFFNPLTAVDVCGHELTHAVTQFTAGLVYASESGALNESFSDVFGKAIEYAALPSDFSWLLGEKIMVVPGTSIRTMQDPNLRGDPKFYEGAFWHTDPSDNFGVHTNSGVQNYWYFLMVEGGQGTAENGYAFDIQGLGWEKSNQIAYRNLTEYLTPSSGFLDAREGALQAATDLYGFCSEEYITVSKAWAAVGVGFEVRDGDYVLEPNNDLNSACDLDELEVTIEFYNNGCNESLAAGTSVPVAYQVDGNAIVTESVMLTTAMEPGQLISYTFSQNAAVNGYGEHLLKVWATPANDVIPDNNYVENVFYNRPVQNDDFGLLGVRDPGGVCDYEPNKFILASAAYFGCDSLSPTELPFSWFYKGTTFNDLELTFIKMAPFDQLPVAGEVYFTEYGFGTGTFRLDFPDDSNEDNDIGTFYLARLDQLTEGWKEDFSVSGLDSVHLGIYQTDYTNCGIQIFDDYSYIMTGSEILNDFGNLLVRPNSDPEAFMRFNSDFVTTMDLCLDVAGMDNPYLFFDLAQTRSTTVDYQQYDINPDFSTMFGVFIDGVQIGPLIYGGPNDGEFVGYEYDLNAYKDGQYHLELRALGLTASLAPNSNIEIDGDNNIVDYVQIANKIDISTTAPLAPEVMKIAPNPSTGAFYLTREDGETFTKGSIEVFDASGKLQIQDLLGAASSNYSFGADLAPGIYFVRVVDGVHSGYSKIVKQ